MRNLTGQSSRTASMWVIAFTLVTGSAVLSAGAGVSANPLSNLFNRSEQLHEYRALRRMHASTEKASHEAWLEAWTELKGGRFTYQIVSERGSEAVRGKVLRAMLEREADLVNSGNVAKGDLTPQNYEFSEAGRDADGTRVVQLKPKRNDPLLVEGRAVLSDGGDLVRVEGRLSKNPSFWTSLVNIVRRYARVGGVRVPVATETTAKVKFVGASQLEVLYEYESVNGRPVAVSELQPAAPAHTAVRSGW
jgi:hypothetical protein